MNWPKQSEASSFYGRHVLRHGEPTEGWERQNIVNAAVPYPLRLSWQTDQSVMRIRCHKLCRGALLTAFERIKSLYGDLKTIQAHGMDLYGGCYNYRPIRGGHTLSMHAYGAAIDLDPEHNPQGRKWAASKGMVPVEVVKIFEDLGATWGGTFSNPDCMHFQFASI